MDTGTSPAHGGSRRNLWVIARPRLMPNLAGEAQVLLQWVIKQGQIS